MDGKTSKYVVVESSASGIVNGLLNLAAGYALFHGHLVVPAVGAGSLFKDLIGETFLVTSLSALAAFLITRHRRKKGALPESSYPRLGKTGNSYLRAAFIGLIFTCIFVPLNSLVLPHMFPDGVTFRNVLLFKTFYGVILGAMATGIALYKALHEAD